MFSKDLNCRHIKPGLVTLSQTTNFRLFQTERVWIQQFQILWKWQKILKMDRKHCGKRRNCLLRTISSFPAVFPKDFYCRHVKTRACLGKKRRSESYLYRMHGLGFPVGLKGNMEDLFTLQFSTCCNGNLTHSYSRGIIITAVILNSLTSGLKYGMRWFAFV